MEDVNIMYFEIIGKITDVETIAVSHSIRELQKLRTQYGGRRWRKLKGIASVRLDNGNIRQAEVHWYECHGIGKRRMKVKQFLDWKTMKTSKKTRFVICTKNEDAEDLSLHKIYQILPDEEAAKENYICVIDESGEDYLYPATYFVSIELPQEAQEALLVAV